MALSKIFAEGELLTAEDVNTHLVNRITRIELNGPAAIPALAQGSLTQGTVLVDVNAETESATVHVKALIGGVSCPAGQQSTDFITLALGPGVGFATFEGLTAAGTLVHGLISASGALSIRNATAAVSGSSIYLGASFAVPAP